MPPVLITTYRRTTFVSRTGEARLTCDSGCGARLEHEVHDTGTHVLVESKSAGQDGRPDQILRALGIRQASVSKYCVASPRCTPSCRPTRGTGPCGATSAAAGRRLSVEQRASSPR